jgi:hypothetical protein
MTSNGGIFTMFRLFLGFHQLEQEFQDAPKMSEHKPLKGKYFRKFIIKSQ